VPFSPLCQIPDVNLWVVEEVLVPVMLGSLYCETESLIRRATFVAVDPLEGCDGKLA
jgi:hypothetical protein